MGAMERGGGGDQLPRLAHHAWMHSPVKLALDKADGAFSCHSGPFNVLAVYAPGQSSTSLQISQTQPVSIGFCPQTVAAKPTSFPLQKSKRRGSDRILFDVCVKGERQ